MANVNITGISQFERDLQQFPINADKVVEKAMRKGGNEVAKSVRSKIPESFRGVVKSKLYSKGEGSQVLVGLFKKGDGGNTDDGYIPKFFKAYWQNYGTMANRDKSHQFDYPRKSKSSRFKGGIKPRGWFQRAVRGADNIFLPAMEKEYGKLIERVFANGKPI